MTRAFITLLFISGLLSSCIALREPHLWWYRQLSSTKESKPYIDIALKKQTYQLPVPLIVWNANRSTNYKLAINFIADTLKYKRLDSIYYRLQTPNKQLIAEGLLPLLSGQVTLQKYLPVAPDNYRAQCFTAPSVKLEQNPYSQKQILTGSFVIYATDIHNRTKLLFITDRPLAFIESTFKTIF